MPDTPSPDTVASSVHAQSVSLPPDRVDHVDSALVEARKHPLGDEADKTLEWLQNEVLRMRARQEQWEEGTGRHPQPINITLETRRNDSSPPSSTRDRFKSILRRRGVIALVGLLLSGGGGNIVTEGRLWEASWAGMHAGIHAFFDTLSGQHERERQRPPPPPPPHGPRDGE